MGLLASLRAVLCALPVAGMALAATPALARDPAAPRGNFPYVYMVNDDGTTRVWRSNVIPLWPDRICFGWTMQVEGRDRSLELTEILTLSAPAKTMIAGPETVIENSQKATTKLTVKVEGGQISRAWCIVEGDPPGQYRFDIYFDGMHRGEFVYCAVPVPEDEPVDVEKLACPYRLESVGLTPPPWEKAPDRL